MTEARLSAREVAVKFLATKSTKVRNELVADARSRCTGKASSKKKRWERLAVAMEAGDASTVERYADFAAWSAKQNAAKAAAKPKGKPAAKPKASTKPAAKPKAASEPDARKVAEAFGIDPDLMVAFVDSAKRA